MRAYHHRLVGTILALSGAVAPAAWGAELSYRWEKGKVYRFSAKSDETIEMSGMGIGSKERYRIDSTFAIQVDKVRPDGKAEGALFIESFAVTRPDGAKLAGLEGLPPAALANSIEIDKKGGFKFKEEVFLVIDEASGQNLVVTGRGGAGSASATAKSGEQEVSVWASFDPKTGTLSGGATVKELSKPAKKQKKVKVRQDKPQVDLLPTRFMELLRLPEGQVAAGSGVVKIEHPNLAADMHQSAEILELTAERVRIRTTIRTDTKAQVPVQPAEDGAAQEPAGGGMPALPGMEGMPQIAGMPGMGGAKPGAVSMGVTMNGDATIDFAPAEGMLSKVAGTLQTRTSMGGVMSVNSEAKLELTRKK